MQIGKPIVESKLPPAKKTAHYKYLAVYEGVMKLANDQLLPVTFEDDKRAKKFAQSVMHTAFAKFRAYTRDSTVYIRLWNDADDKHQQHIKELREKARLRKQNGK